MLCKWNVPKSKDASMSRVSDINWRSTTNQQSASSRKPNDSFHCYIDSIQKFEDDVIVNFINDIFVDGSEPALRTVLFPEEKRRASTIKDEIFLSNLYGKDYLYKELSELVRIGKSVKVEISKEDIAEITRITVAQTKSKLWISLRRGRITGSNLKDCCTTSIVNPSITTISRVINPIKGLTHAPSAQYTTKLKKKAIKQYVHEACENHENFEYEPRGLIFNAKLPFFTDSSEGLVSCSCDGEGCLVIKCLKILEKQSLDSLTRKPNNILNKFGEQYYLENSHEFFYKAQMNIHLSETNYCDFVLWSPTKYLILRVIQDAEFWKEVSSKALSFHEKVIMPELLAKFFTKGKRAENGEQNIESLNEERLELIDLEIEILYSDDCDAE